MTQFTRRNFLMRSALLTFLLPSLTKKAIGQSSLANLHLQDQWYMQPDGWVPNNPYLPVVHFRSTKQILGSDPNLIPDLTKAGWSSQWISKPFSYQHFHSSSHAIFVVSSGNGLLQVGGDAGKTVHAIAGDMLFLPAGTGQRLIKSSDDFQVIACYPNGRAWDVCRSAVNPATMQKTSYKMINKRTHNLFTGLGAVI